MSAVRDVLAIIGALAVLGSLGLFIFTWRTAASGEHDPAEPTPTPLATWQDSREAYRNVRVLPPAQAVKGQAPGSGPVPTNPPPSRRLCGLCGLCGIEHGRLSHVIAPGDYPGGAA